MAKYSIEIKWGFVFAATTLIWAIIGKVLGMDGANIQYSQPFNTAILLPGLIIYILAAIDKRNNYYNGSISFKQSFVSGLILSLIVTVLGVLTTLISLKVISPQLLTNSAHYYSSTGAMSAAAAQQQFTLGTYIITGVVAGPVTGAVLALIASLVIKKNRK